MHCFVYVLRSKQDGKRYIGISNNIRIRFDQHNRGEIKSTKGRRPFILEYFERQPDKISARRREQYFKTAAGRRFLNSLAGMVELADTYV